MEDTIREVVISSKLAVSLIIVGVGDADFSDMDILDSDDERLVDEYGNRQVRDNVQFVPYNKVKGDKT
eukprot:CAMPEP_0116897406 /NCGR_PEP_ID=MMETSP0467-20121206/6394_1 /TAXON_ID=283647 /ORGANISM="Mesodinium pulex, Strain SPMC105" /LENGTH=67 /DNA_ID=CAMNT_0004569033 /DNA_START=1400 /DNA_END=1603 /DNA_ORIENTATION=+